MYYLSNIRINDLLSLLKSLQNHSKKLIDSKATADHVRLYHKKRHDKTEQLIRVLRDWKDCFQAG